MRVIKHLKFSTDFFGSGFEHNLYDVDVKDIELGHSSVMGNRYWKLTVRGKEYNVAPLSDTLIIKSRREQVRHTIKNIEDQIDNAVPTLESGGADE